MILMVKVNHSNMYRQLVLCFVLTVVASGVLYKDVEVHTGTVRGYAAEDGDYFAFLGIPYVAPPLGEQRFKNALPMAPWDGIYRANHTVICPQFGQGDENCLIVNIFTPTNIFDAPLPVLVYIHGGSFLIGQGQTKGMEPLVKQNIIVVTMNYRLGALGFLCLGNEEAPGNAGLRDQIAALKWVRTNIAEFGGDPNQVTLYGMSAGGASVDLLLVSKMGKGLFRQAIIESGTATTVWAIDGKPIETAQNFARELGFKKENLHLISNYLKTIPANNLSVANYKFYQNLTDGTFGFAPCMEKKVIGVDIIIGENPHKTIKRKAYNKVPTMFIFADLEGLYLRSYDYYTLNYRDRMNINFKDFIPADLMFDNVEIRDEITENIRNFYFGNETVRNETSINYLNYFGDSLVMHGLLNSAVNYAKDDNTVYLMEFGYKGKLGSKEDYFEHIKRAGHGDAVKYVLLRQRMEKSDKLAVDRMTKIIYNFCKYGKPIPNRTDLLPIHWPILTPDSVTYLRFDNELEVHQEPHWERKTFWDRIYDGYRRDLKPAINHADAAKI